MDIMARCPYWRCEFSVPAVAGAGRTCVGGTDLRDEAFWLFSQQFCIVTQLVVAVKEILHEEKLCNILAPEHI